MEAQVRRNCDAKQKGYGKHHDQACGRVETPSHPGALEERLHGGGERAQARMRVVLRGIGLLLKLGRAEIKPAGAPCPVANRGPRMRPVDRYPRCAYREK